MKKIFILIIVLFLFSNSFAQDSSLVRIKINHDSLNINLNDSLYHTDSYGNLPVLGSWYILKLPQNEYKLLLESENYNSFDTSFTVVPGEVITVDITLLPKIPTTKETESIIIEGNQSKLEITSDPDSGIIYIDRVKTDKLTPAVINISPQSTLIEVYREGYEPLAERVEPDSGQTISMHFILNFLQPASLIPESLGLELMIEFPLKDTLKAKIIRNKFNGMAESFAIVPLSQGLLARLVVGENSKKEANVLIISGVTLTLGSYLLGHFFSSRKKNQIIKYNEQMKKDNQVSQEHNQIVNQQTREMNNEKLRAWKKSNSSRGRVLISVK